MGEWNDTHSVLPLFNFEKIYEQYNLIQFIQCGVICANLGLIIGCIN